MEEFFELLRFNGKNIDGFVNFKYIPVPRDDEVGEFPDFCPIANLLFRPLAERNPVLRVIPVPVSFEKVSGDRDESPIGADENADTPVVVTSHFRDGHILVDLEVLLEERCKILVVDVEPDDQLGIREKVIVARVISVSVRADDVIDAPKTYMVFPEFT